MRIATLTMGDATKGLAGKLPSQGGRSLDVLLPETMTCQLSVVEVISALNRWRCEIAATDYALPRDDFLSLGRSAIALCR
ncbi:MAG: hypothetical protein RMJ54_03940 [Roseiflexaceae bacterium]|nr:hypothetical protein [Roseiflexaceae bacterium]